MSRLANLHGKRGRRPIAHDEYVRDFDRLDAASRSRALTEPESLRLEECVRRLDRRAVWRRRKGSLSAVNPNPGAGAGLSR